MLQGFRLMVYQLMIAALHTLLLHNVAYDHVTLMQQSRAISLMGLTRFTTFTVWCWTLMGVYFLMATGLSIVRVFVVGGEEHLHDNKSVPELALIVAWVLYELSFAMSLLVTAVVTFILIPLMEKSMCLVLKGQLQAVLLCRCAVAILDVFSGRKYSPSASLLSDRRREHLTHVSLGCSGHAQPESGVHVYGTGPKRDAICPLARGLCYPLRLVLRVLLMVCEVACHILLRPRPLPVVLHIIMMITIGCAHTQVLVHEDRCLLLFLLGL